MTDELGFSADVYGFGVGIFFVGYFLFEIPGSIIVEKWSARLWISRIMITWGLLAILTGFIHSANAAYATRRWTAIASLFGSVRDRYRNAGASPALILGDHYETWPTATHTRRSTIGNDAGQ